MAHIDFDGHHDARTGFDVAEPGSIAGQNSDDVPATRDIVDTSWDIPNIEFPPLASADPIGHGRGQARSAGHADRVGRKAAVFLEHPVPQTRSREVRGPNTHGKHAAGEKPSHRWTAIILNTVIVLAVLVVVAIMAVSYRENAIHSQALEQELNITKDAQTITTDEATADPTTLTALDRDVAQVAAEQTLPACAHDAAAEQLDGDATDLAAATT